MSNASGARMRFEEVVGFEGDPARVWIRASAIAEMPNYWCGTRSLLVTHESGGAKHAKVKFAFGDPERQRFPPMKGVERSRLTTSRDHS